MPTTKKRSSSKSGKERRRLKRWKVAVLVRCSLPQISKDVFEMEMWAKDVNEKGMQLEWARGLGAAKLSAHKVPLDTQSIRFDDVKFEKGAKIMVQDLFYDDDGSPFMEGVVLWAKQVPASGSWALGIKFVKNDKQTADQLGAFKDFLSIIRNPVAAISRASKKKK